MFISREIEGNLDRDEIDFSLQVASCGATSPLIKARQYSKHYGRTLSIKTSDDQYEGKLTSANERFINIVWKVREPKPIGKGKITVEKSIDIDYNKIKEAKVKVKF
jgi:ribosome maturation factor RimP